MKGYDRPLDGARVIRVIETTLLRRGNGIDTVLRCVRQYWSLDGELLAEVDPLAGQSDLVSDQKKGA